MWRGLFRFIIPIGMGASAAFAQVRVEQGNVLDANPRLGSGGLNYGARQYNVNTANRIVTGNVTGGAGFQGFSPIRDPSSFFLSGTSTLLPSDRLSSFNARATSPYTVQRGLTAPGLPYYAPQSTVANTGAIIAGLNRPGTSQLITPYAPARPDLRVQPVNPLSTSGAQTQGTALSVPTELARIDTGQPITGPVNPRLLNSPLFGGVRMVPLTALASEARQAAALGAAGVEPAAVDLRAGSAEPLDLRRKQEPSAPAELIAPAGTESTGLPAARNQPGAPAPGLSSSQARSAVDVFNEMRGQFLRPLEPVSTLQQQSRMAMAAGAELIQPIAPQPTAGGAAPPAEAGPAAATPAPTEAPAAPRQTPSMTLRTFVGTEQSVLNRYLAEAESKLHAGQYYRAASLYDLARTVEPRNPLPLLGQSMALLAAGDYMTSATDLLQAIQLFESLAQFRIDLKVFVPDLNALDRRRADLERRLERREDFRLRFLLGFAEYSSGFENLGLEDMRKAAAAAPPEWSAVQRFVANLQHAQRPTTAPALDIPQTR